MLVEFNFQRMRQSMFIRPTFLHEDKKLTKPAAIDAAELVLTAKN